MKKQALYLLFSTVLFATLSSFVACDGDDDDDDTQDAGQDDSEQDDDEEVDCAADAMICPDGTAVGRSGPDCEFDCSEHQLEEGCRTNADCDSNSSCVGYDSCGASSCDVCDDCLEILGSCEPVVCTDDLFVCPDGTEVGRTGQNCEFDCSEHQLPESCVTDEDCEGDDLCIGYDDCGSDPNCPECDVCYEIMGQCTERSCELLGELECIIDGSCEAQYVESVPSSPSEPSMRFSACVVATEDQTTCEAQQDRATQLEQVIIDYADSCSTNDDCAVVFTGGCTNFCQAALHVSHVDDYEALLPRIRDEVCLLDQDDDCFYPTADCAPGEAVCSAGACVIEYTDF